MAALLLNRARIPCVMQLLVACLLVSSAVAAAATQHNTSSCFPSDLQALVSFASGLHALLLDNTRDRNLVAMNINESWSSERDCCSWEGVTCTISTRPFESTMGSDYARVTALSLQVYNVSSGFTLESLCNLPLLSTLDLSMSLIRPSGDDVLIPECLGEQLPLLQVLTLSNLNLKGVIPSSFSRLLHLQHLDLSSNPDLSGSLLPLLHLPSLTSLFLSICSISGPLPTFNTPLLQSLSISGCSISGPLPTFNYTPLLQSLSISGCSISGPLPTFNTPLLQSLSLTDNYLNSTLDQFTRLSNLTRLTLLDLSGNSISGPIPSSISRLVNLQSLHLERNSLSGALPDSLCELSHLITLDLSDNILATAELLYPESCTQLIDLTTLDLSSNNFSDPFPPWIAHFSSLASLDLSSNQFAGPIPDAWQNLQNLIQITLGSGNSLRGTGLPEWLFRLPKMRWLRLISLGLQSEDVLCSTRVSMLNKTLEGLDLSGNNITGRDLLECFALHNFKQDLRVWLDDNPLSIALSHIQLSPKISALSLSGCNLTGFLNDRVFEGRDILNLSHNKLVGKIPTKHTNLTATVDLDLSNNYFTGLDSLYGSFKSLWDIQLSKNLIAGDVSTVLRTLGLNCSNTDGDPSIPPWAYLGLSYNELVGTIPASLAECQNGLASLYLDNNNLTGQIPDNFGKFYNLYSIRLSNNHLKGTIPASIITKRSQLLEVSYNELEGDLKSLFSFLQSPTDLVVLGLAHNRISGSIPPFLGNFTPALRVIDLSYNNLTGNIPPDLYLPSFQNLEILMSDIHVEIKALYELGTPLMIKGVERTVEYVLKNFRFLDLSKNHLEGFIPSELGELSALMQLNLSHNSLSGPIPEAFGKLSLLETLDLSFNKLQGSIPTTLSSLSKLSVFNVSYNEALAGPIPPGTQLENNESYRGDPLLCGYPVLHRACQVVDVTNTSNNMQTINEKVAAWMDEWIAVPGLCLGIVVGFFGVSWFLARA